MMKALIGMAAALLALAPAAALAAEAPAPANVVTVQLASGNQMLHPLTTHRFPVGPPEENDPVNLIFEGAADPREIRAALLSVSGDRSAYRIPFNCTWADDEGEEQATWTADAGWEGGAIQLGCGGYDFRFHLRLFRHGARTLGGVHLDLQVPGTTTHQVLSWDVPQQLVMVDMVRSGLLAADPYLTDAFGPTPTHRGIPWYVFNELPPELRAGLFLPPDDVAIGESAPIPCNGRAVVLNVVSSYVPAQSDTRRHFVIDFGQVIGKPFCNPDGTEVVLVEGPVHFNVRFQTNPSGRHLRTVLISGLLAVTPLDPRTYQPTGPTVQAFIFEENRGMLTDNIAEVSWTLGRTITSLSQVLAQSFTAGQHDSFSYIEECGATTP